MFLIVDLETTNREPEQAHVLEWAIIPTADLFSPEKRGEISFGFVRPPVPIPPETSAVHHIVDRDVEGAPSWYEDTSVTIKTMIDSYRPVLQAIVAHNTAMERMFIEPLAVGIPWLCTYKAALRVWPDAPGHSNEALRYWLKLPHLGRAYEQRTHSAIHDARVTLGILERLTLAATVSDMVRWESEPTMLPRCPIGEYRNLPWSEVPSDWLSWALSKPTMREDVVFCAREELKRREDDIESIVF